MKKKLYIILPVIFVLGLLIGGFTAHKIVMNKLETFVYSSEKPVSLTITDQEMEAKPRLLELIKEYGQFSEETNLLDAYSFQKESMELLKIVPKGSEVTELHKEDSIVYLRYRLNGLHYSVCYLEEGIEKAVVLPYGKGHYDVSNLDNKEYAYQKTLIVN